MAKTEMGLLWSVVMMRSVKDCDPSFSYHATVSSSPEADSASTSPSPSTSMAKTDQTASADAVMTRGEQAARASAGSKARSQKAPSGSQPIAKTIVETLLSCPGLSLYSSTDEGSMSKLKGKMVECGWGAR